MQQRDSRVADLQSENQELKQLLMATIEASSTTGGAGGDQGLPEGEGSVPPGEGILEQLLVTMVYSRVLHLDYRYLFDEGLVILQGSVKGKDSRTTEPTVLRWQESMVAATQMPQESRRRPPDLMYKG
ncbi:GIP, partial [Symbiodinium sp. KB8]